MIETNSSLNRSARIAGAAWLMAMATSILGYIPAQYVVGGDIVQTATNIIDNERLF